MFAWLLASSLVFGAPALKDEGKSPKAPEGRWAVERMERDGQVWEGASLQGRVVIYTKTKCTLEINGAHYGTEAAEYRVARGVQQVDFSAEGLSGVKKGIWKVDGDTLTVCESEPGGERPSDFTAPAGSKRSLFVHKRIKD